MLGFATPHSPADKQKYGVGGRALLQVSGQNLGSFGFRLGFVWVALRIEDRRDLSLPLQPKATVDRAARAPFSFPLVLTLSMPLVWCLTLPLASPSTLTYRR